MGVCDGAGHPEYLGMVVVVCVERFLSLRHGRELVVRVVRSDELQRKVRGIQRDRFLLDLVVYDHLLRVQLLVVIVGAAVLCCERIVRNVHGEHRHEYCQDEHQRDERGRPSGYRLHDLTYREPFIKIRVAGGSSLRDGFQKSPKTLSAEPTVSGIGSPAMSSASSNMISAIFSALSLSVSTALDSAWNAGWDALSSNTYEAFMEPS